MSGSLAQLLARAGELASAGCPDQAGELLDQAIALAPSRDDLIVKRAWLDHMAGEDATARARLEATQLDGVAAVEAAVLTMEMDVRAGLLPSARVERIAAMVQAVSPWDDLHERFVAACRQSGHDEQVLGFLGAWLNRQPSTLRPVMRAGELLLELGMAEPARNLLTLVGRQARAEMDDLIGPWDAIADDGSERDDDVLAEIERAFSQPESALARVSLPDGPIAPKAVRVLYVGAGSSGWGLNGDNDMAAHFAGSNRMAGGTCDVWLDTALVLPGLAQVPRRQVDEAVERFRAAIAAQRPDLVMLDITMAPLDRGLTPALVLEMKAQYGFRVCGQLRDVLKVNQPTVDAWAPACDSMICFDPAAYLMEAGHPLVHKMLVLPVPTQHAPFAPTGEEAQRGLLFVGSTSGVHRSLLIALLAGSDVDFQAVIGPQRKVLAPDQAAYARLLARSRAVLNVSGHHAGPYGHLVTGRVWETIACGALLVEQDYRGTKGFLTPWRHFLPWSKPADIIRRWRVLARHEEWRASIAAEARDWTQRCYGNDAVWRAIVNRTLR